MKCSNHSWLTINNGVTYCRSIFLKLYKPYMVPYFWIFSIYLVVNFLEFPDSRFFWISAQCPCRRLDRPNVIHRCQPVCDLLIIVESIKGAAIKLHRAERLATLENVGQIEEFNNNNNIIYIQSMRLSCAAFLVDSFERGLFIAGL